MNRFRIHQQKYVQHIIKEYETEHKVVLSPISTPLKHRRDEKDRELSLIPGHYVARGAEQTGKLWCLAWVERRRKSRSAGPLVPGREVEQGGG